MDNPSIWIAFGSLLFTIFCTSVGTAWALSWRISGIEKEIRKDHQIDILNLERKINEVAESSHRAIGGASSAAIQNIQRVELYVRDQLHSYVLKEDFRDDLGTVTKIVDSLGNRLEERLGSMEKKMDDLRNRIPTMPT